MGSQKHNAAYSTAEETVTEDLGEEVYNFRGQTQKTLFGLPNWFYIISGIIVLMVVSVILISKNRDPGLHRELEMLANSGDVEAQYQLGMLYKERNRSKKDYIKAHEWLEKAANSKDVEAMYELGKLQLQSEIPINGIRTLEVASSYGHVSAQIELGKCYRDGVGTIRDEFSASPWFIIAMLNGSKEAVQFVEESKRTLTYDRWEAAWLSAVNDVSQNRAVDNNIPTDCFYDYVFVPGGTFIMGDTYAVDGTQENKPHKVTLSSFIIGKYEVTQEEWVYLMRYNPSLRLDTFPNTGPASKSPVFYLTWYEALVYCNLRSMKEGLTPVYTISGSTNPSYWGAVPISQNATWDAAVCNWNANGYRLPTEAEWEYAARGATNNPDYLYSGSNNINEVGWYSGWGTQLVGMKRPNQLGTYDMSGNVGEWCWDWWGYYDDKSTVNPRGPLTGDYRMRRGGCATYPASNCRVSGRFRLDPSFRGNPHTGLRICRALN